jgi:hypothetical protein
MAPDPANPDGPWVRRDANLRPLLEAVSQVGAASPYLTREWTRARRQLLALIDRGRVQ